MSMPSSSEEVATIARSRPALSASSISVRWWRASEPWWARTSSSPASSVRRAGEPLGESGRALTNTIVERVRGSGRAAAGRSAATSPPPWGAGRREDRAGWARDRLLDDASSSAMSSTGTTISSSSAGGARRRRSSPAGVRGLPPRYRATLEWPLGRRQADALRRRAGADGSSRSSVSARCAPRLVGAIAWISSTMTHRTLRRVVARRAASIEVERLGRRDQDVRRALPSAALLAGVSPVRTPTVGSCANRRPRGRRRARARRAGRAGSARRRPRAPGAARRRARGCVPRAGGPARRPSRSMPTGTRRASCPARSARASACGPRGDGAQPSRWAGVGSSNLASNHVRTAGEKTSSVTAHRTRSTDIGGAPARMPPCSVLPERRYGEPCLLPRDRAPRGGHRRSRARGVLYRAVAGGIARPRPRERRQPGRAARTGRRPRRVSRSARWSSSPAGSSSRASSGVTSSSSRGPSRSPAR